MATESRASDLDVSDTEWHSPTVTLSRLAADAEGDEYLADINFGDGVNNADTAQDGIERVIALPATAAIT